MAIDVSKNKRYFKYCRAIKWSCCTSGDIRKIGDNYNRADSNFSSKTELYKSWKQYWETIDSLFTNKVTILSKLDEVLKAPKATKEAKDAANELKKLYQVKDTENLQKANAKGCYNHTGKVAQSSICSVCDFEAKNRYNDFKKEFYLNQDDIRIFKGACLRHIDESLPIISTLLKNIFIISNMTDDFSKPKDVMVHKQSKNFDSQKIGKLEEHQKCIFNKFDQKTIEYCDRFINMYYTQGILLKPEFHVVPEVKIIKKWLFKLKTQKKAQIPKKPVSKRRLTTKDKKKTGPTEIIPAGGIKQIMTKYWKLKYLPDFDKVAPKTALLNYAQHSQLNVINFTAEPRLRSSSKYHRPKASWENKPKKTEKSTPKPKITKKK